jgi:tripartite-type tricarboxylate transporter receptor subunit TctC
MTRRRPVLCILAAGLLLASSLPALAAWPERPIRIIFPFAVGGVGGNLSQIMADGLTQRLGQPVIVESKPGAGGALGFQYVKNAAPDGYTLVLGSNGPATILPLLNKSVGYDVDKDFEPVGMAVIGGNVIAVNALSDIRSFADLRTKARASPGTLSYGSAGNGTTFHLGPTLFDIINGSQMVHVPYKGGGPALMGLLGNETDVVFGAMDIMTHVRAGKLRALAAMSKQRLAAAPDVPTTAELGMPELEVVSFYGLLAPKGTPAAIIDRISRELGVVMSSESARQQLGVLLLEPAPDTSSDYLKQRITNDTARWRKVIETAGIAGQ